MQQRIVFMGTPTFAIPALDVIALRCDVENVLVLTQPDRAAGRGRKMQAPPVKVRARELGVTSAQTSTMKDPSIRQQLEDFAPDLIVVAAFGLILPKWVLRLPVRSCVNLHASDLPRFRGASPVAAAIAAGDSHAGIALMEMEPGLDTGGVFSLERVDIAHSDTTGSLTGTLAHLGATLLDRHLDALMSGAISPKPQAGVVIETRKITKDHGAIDWGQPAISIERHVRAMLPWPRAWTVTASETRIQVHAAEVLDSVAHDAPGTVIGHDDGVLVSTGDGVLKILTLQFPGKSAQAARGLKQHPGLAVDTRFGWGDDFTPPQPWIVTKGIV